MKINIQSILNEKGECRSYCSHGGHCIKKKGHEMPHESGYCTWNKGLTKKKADKILLKKWRKQNEK